MDEHKKAMIQQWVEGQARGGPSVPPSHLTGVDSLAWLQERAEEQAQGQYTALTQFKVAESSTSSCSSTPPEETQAVVEREDPSPRLQEPTAPLATSAPISPAKGSSAPPPPPLRGVRGEAEEQQSVGSKISSGSRGSSRRSDAATTTEGLGSSGHERVKVIQDPYGAPRKVVQLPRASPEHVPGTRTLEEVYQVGTFILRNLSLTTLFFQHCEALVETLSQASEELKAKEGGREEGLRISGIDDIEIYSVEEGSEGSVEVRIIYGNNY